MASCLDLLVDLLLVRRLAPWQGNVKKRLVKAPKVYVRESGLVHALLRVGDESLLAHPVAGGSWESLAIESLIAAAPNGSEAYFFRRGRRRDRPAAEASRSARALGDRGQARARAEDRTGLPSGLR